MLRLIMTLLLMTGVASAQGTFPKYDKAKGTSDQIHPSFVTAAGLNPNGPLQWKVVRTIGTWQTDQPLSFAGGRLTGFAGPEVTTFGSPPGAVFPSPVRPTHLIHASGDGGKTWHLVLEG